MEKTVLLNQICKLSAY